MVDNGRLAGILDALTPYMIAVGMGVFIWMAGPKIKICSRITNMSECTAAGCSWYDNACHATPEIIPDAEVTTIKVY